MAKIRGLQKKRDGWYVRKRVPTDLKAVIGKGEIVRTLQTQDLATAKRNAPIVEAKILSEFHEARVKLLATTPDMLSDYSEQDLQSLSLRWFDELANRKVSQGTEEYTAEDFEIFHQERLIEHDIVQREANGIFEDQEYQGMNAAASYLNKIGITYKRTSPAFRTLANLFSICLYESASRDVRFYEGKAFAPTHPMFLSRALTGLSTTLEQKNTKKITFKELVQEYMHNSSVKRGRSTINNYTMALRIFIDLFGDDKDIRQITRDDCKYLKSVVEKLPANSTKKSAGKHTLESVQLAETYGWPIISPATINQNLSKLSAIFEFAMKEGYIVQNHFSGLRVADTVKKKHKRNPFTDEELKKIFASSRFQKKAVRDADFWVPLIALWTGMRLNEICQLETDDIVLKDGIDIILVRPGNDENDEKRVKTEAGNRYIPVHPQLKQIGFMKFILKAKQRKQRRIFSEIDAGALGYYSSNFSKRFGYYLDSIGVKDARNSFHSFRHNFRDALREAELPPEAVLHLGGWSGKGADADYGAGLKATTLYKHVCKIEYQGLDLSHLYI